MALVYDVVDTGGKELPRDVAAFFASGSIGEPQIAQFRERTNRKNILWADLDAGDAKAGAIRCTKKATNDRERNVYKMQVNKNHLPAVRFATVAHKLAHLFLGHLGPDNALRIPERPTGDHSQQKLEAESVAFLVCKRNGVASASETYLANYVDQNTSVGALDIYQVMRATGQVETVLGLGAQTRFQNKQGQGR